MKFNKLLFPVIFLIIINITKINCQGQDQIDCIKCNNKDTKDCLDKAKSLNSTTKCKTCVMYVNLNDQYLYRGCYDDDIKKIVGDCEKNSTCKTCNENECNIDPNFPLKTRQQCYTCNDANCFKGSSLNDSVLEYCAKYVDKCFTYVKDATSTLRGCLSNEKDSTCTENNKCLKCDSTKCNNLNSEIELSCYECSGDNEKCKRSDTTSEDCKLSDDNIKECYKYLLGHEDPKEVCYIKRSGNNVERGCYIKNKPSKEQNSTIEISGNKGNSGCLTDLKCIKCSDNQKCKNDEDEKLKDLAIDCGKFTTSCFRYDDKDGNTVRGCGAPKDFIRSSSFCYNDKCIAKRLENTCYYCHSENDANCAQLEDVTKLKTKTCADGDSCVVKINEHGHTVRGCRKDVLGDKTCDTNDKLCYNCTDYEQPCNGAIFPKDRRQCYQCKNCDDLAQQKSLPCRLYNKDDKCYMFPSSDNNSLVTRGCLSDTDANKMCEDAKEKCYKCDINKCNDAGKLKCPRLKCIQCDSNNNDDCKWGFNQEQSVWCKNQIDYWKNEACYTCNIDGKVTRGCEWDASTALSDKCKKCSGDGCNRLNEVEFTCLRCRSDNPEQESCDQDGAKIKPSACTNVVTNADKGCFVNKNVKTGVIIRGCLVDLVLSEDRLKCKDNNYPYCKSCLESNCNNQSLSSGAQNKFISTSSVALCLIFTSFIKFLW